MNITWEYGKFLGVVEIAKIVKILVLSYEIVIDFSAAAYFSFCLSRH